MDTTKRHITINRKRNNINKALYDEGLKVGLKEGIAKGRAQKDVEYRRATKARNKANKQLQDKISELEFKVEILGGIVSSATEEEKVTKPYKKGGVIEDKVNGRETQYYDERSGKLLDGGTLTGRYTKFLNKYW